MPDVELHTTGGPGVPMLASSYATEKGIPVLALLPDFDRFPREAAEVATWIWSPSLMPLSRY